MSGAPDAAGATLTINLGALAANWRLLRDRAAPAECAAVVKADAYGIGLEQAGRALARAGCLTFFVAHPGEAIRLRAELPEAAIYVLNGLPSGAEQLFAAQGLRPILGSWPELRDWAAFCRSENRRHPAALHVDTGMNRLGFRPEEAARLVADDALGAIEPTLLMSHLVAAEEPVRDVNARQIRAFDVVRATLTDIPASLANSAGIFLPQRPHHALVRPGYALYGGNPTPWTANPMRPVVRLEARIIQVREVEGGETAGYNARWTAPGPRRLATLSVGYADGFLRSGSAADGTGAAALVAGHPCPVVGTISMDLTILDVTDAPRAERGDAAVLIGDGLEIDEVGRRAGTIGYEILTSLGRRYARRYLDEA